MAGFPGSTRRSPQSMKFRELPNGQRVAITCKAMAVRQARRFRRRRAWASRDSSSRCSSQCSGWAATQRKRWSPRPSAGRSLQDPSPSVERCRQGACFRTESYDVFVARPLPIHHPLPILLLFYPAGLRHRSVLRMPGNKSYSGIQPNTACKDGDLLALTMVVL